MQLRWELGSDGPCDGSPDGSKSKTRPRGESERLESMTITDINGAVLFDVSGRTIFSSNFGMLQGLLGEIGSSRYLRVRD